MTATTNNRRWPPNQWLPLFLRAGVERDRFVTASSSRAKATIIGNFFGRNIDREVRVQVHGQKGTARLRMEQGRGRQKLYYFEVRLDGPPEEEQPGVAATPCPAPEPTRGSEGAQQHTPREVEADTPGRADHVAGTGTAPNETGEGNGGNDESW